MSPTHNVPKPPERGQVTQHSLFQWASTRRRRLVAAGILPLLMAAVTMSPAAATGTTTTTPATTVPSASLSPADAAFRTVLANYLKSLGSAVTATAQNPRTSASIAGKVKDDMASLAQAEAQVPNLDATQIEAAENVLGQHPAWASQPAAVANALSTSSAQPAADTPIANPFPGYLSSCSSGVPDNESLFYAYWAAAQVASAASAIAFGVPDGVDFAPLTIVAGVAFGVANGVAIALQGTLSLGLDCATAAFNGTLESTYPTDSNGNFTPASSQISVNALAVVEGSIQTTLDAIQTTVNTVTTDLAAAINSFGIAQGTANTIAVTANDIQNRTNALVSTIGTASDTGTTTANGLANSLNGSQITILADTANFQTLSVRMEIEDDLAMPNSPVVTLFALPASQGGFILTVQNIVATTLGNETAAGQGIGQAQIFFARGNTALAANQYDAAFAQYALAYKAAVA
jgi:hypothetical protein